MLRDVEPFWGSHTAMLQAELERLPSGSLVIEHGAGLYSSTLIARHILRVLLIEELPGWATWGRWLYGDRVEVMDRAKPARFKLPDAALVFIDGVARERGDLLKWSLDAGVPVILAHDTEDDHRKQYGYHSAFFEAKGYDVVHDGVFPRTTRWVRK